MRCFLTDYSPSKDDMLKGCQTCPACFNCASNLAVVMRGYRLLRQTDNEYHVFRCPYKQACPEWPLIETQHQNCSDGHTGALCQDCRDGWSQTPAGSCMQCSSNAGGGTWLWAVLAFVIGLVAALAYYGTHKFLVKKRRKREQARVGAGTMFDCMDSDSSGTITREELREGLSDLGMTMSEATTFQVMDTIDLDGSGDIDRDEFEAWMAHRVTRSQQAITVLKILIGVVQVLRRTSRLPPLTLPPCQLSEAGFHRY